jgi:hypothetical protein
MIKKSCLRFFGSLNRQQHTKDFNAAWESTLKSSSTDEAVTKTLTSE